MDTPSDDADGYDTGSGSDPLAAPATGGNDAGAGSDPLTAPATGGDEAGVPGIPSLRSRLSAISPGKPPRPPVPSAIAAATGPPAERKPVVRTRRVMRSPSEIAALGEYRMMTPEELARAPE